MAIEDILKAAIDYKASDLHVVPNMPPLLRVDGELIPTKYMPVLTPAQTKEMLYSIMNPLQIAEFEKDLAIDMGIYRENLGNFRVNIFHQIDGIAAIFRVVSEVIPSFEELLIPPVIKKLLTLPYGLIIVTGPTGSGKSTTLAAMLDYINTVRGGHIITIEDPIEYIHKNKKCSINQLQVGRDTKTFASALRSSLRQDPDVIMLGEMRDLKSIRLALTAAETGHLVLTTLHASSAAITVNRIIDIFPEAERDRVRNMLSETIQGIICQTLLKKHPSGRVAAFEVMLATPAIRHLISQGRHSHIESAIQTSGDLGMFTMETGIKDLMNKNIITTTSGRIAIAARDSMKFSDPQGKPIGGATGVAGMGANRDLSKTPPK